jgi:predicted ATP-dependent endonuclease of OLD family
MQLKKFRVEKFRSVEDSGWIDVDDVTALIGTNESGKTNILLPLWKLNPAKDGEIVPTSDYPRKSYNEIRKQATKPVFIRAIFEVGEKLAQDLALITGIPTNELDEVEAYRRYDGPIAIGFPKVVMKRLIEQERLADLLTRAKDEIEKSSPLKSEEDLKFSFISKLDELLEEIKSIAAFDKRKLERIQSALTAVGHENAPKTSAIVPRYLRVNDDISEFLKEISAPHPSEIKEATDLVIKSLPKFVYYSTYGNLDSEIYLPHVINNLKRTDLGLKELAKARTLKVLFEFVNLSPGEIRELGNDFRDPSRQPTDVEIATIAEKKKQRSILLQSASTLLTEKFREWWKQGEYRFRFEADGDHFRIWVSDDKRPEEIELEGRSTGLQWFLSFYLVFLVERADAHEDAILLLDEPGLSLHPLAQRDLSAFFDGLAVDNQLVYTCHSPFLVDADRLDRARKVYVGTDGTSKVSSDLRANESDATQHGAAYAVYAALGLSVAESLLLGCLPVVVEGSSDQHYLTAIKNVLISAGFLTPGREFVFPPAGGAKGVRAVASILAGRDDELPVAFFDSDSNGKRIANTLRADLYVDCPQLVLDVETFTRLADSEVEDLLPPNLIAQQLDRWQRSAEVPFSEELEAEKPIVPQIEAWARMHNVSLENPGWKVELAKRVKRQLLADGQNALGITKEMLDDWARLFEKFQSLGSQEK